MPSKVPLHDIVVSLTDTLGSLISLVTPWITVLGAAAALVAAGLTVRRYLWPALKVLYRTCYADVPFGSILALGAVFSLWLSVARRKGEASLYDAVRLRSEVEVFNPRPRRLDFVTRWPNNLDKANKEYKHQRNQWRNRINEVSKVLLREFGDRRGEINLDTHFDLHKAEARVHRYFGVLASVSRHEGPQDNLQFLSKVVVHQGYLVPRHLLSGLLPHFGDEWPELIEAYGRIASTNDSSFLDQYRPFQAHLFSCWLLWGPSISVCTCPQWEGPIALQYGYGDENNSVPVISRLNRHIELYRQFRGQSGAGLAMPAKITGRLRRGDTLKSREICAAQQALRDPSVVMLDAEDIEVINARPDAVTAPYYSSYLWVLFVLCRKTVGEWDPYHNEEPWRCMFPFFEHGNNADRRTYGEYKRMVARSAVSTLGTILSSLRPDEKHHIGFVYASAIDDSACGKSLCIDDGAETSIRVLLREFVKERGLTAQIIVPESDEVWRWFGHFSGCHLPDTITRFLSSISSDDHHIASIDAESTRAAALPIPIEIDSAHFPLLERAYKTLYEREFPDPDERESLDNMKEYVRKKESGVWGDGDYHIGVAEIAGRPIGIVVCDYFQQSRAGVIEFLTVDAGYRERKLGRHLLNWTESRLSRDAKRLNKAELRVVVAEMNDPFAPSNGLEYFDPFDRSAIWHAWGYSVLDIPYVQPALSPTQQPVKHLMLIAKVFHGKSTSTETTSPKAETIAAEVVLDAVADYMRFAMPIKHPQESAEYLRLKQHLDANVSSRSGVRLIPLGNYVGNTLYDGRPLRVVEIGLGDPRFDDVMAIYDEYFTDEATRIPRQEFSALLAEVAHHDQRPARRGNVLGWIAESNHGKHLPRKKAFHYHLWGLTVGTSQQMDGMVSFFTLPHGGFGGYVALRSSALPRTGALRAIIGRIEKQILSDSDIAMGWFIEVETHKANLINNFISHGFFRVDVKYTQPHFSGHRPKSPQETLLTLLYKPIGRMYEVPRLECETLVAWYAEVLEFVYGLSRTSPSFSALREVFREQLQDKKSVPIAV